MDIARFLHPIFSGFPSTLIALLVIAELLELRSTRQNKSFPFRAVSSFLACSLLVGVIASFSSGYVASYFAGELSKDSEALISSHHSLGKILLVNTLLLVTFFWLSRIAERGKNWFRVLYVVTLILQIVLSLTTGNFGGKLVFDHGVGVRKFSAPSTPGAAGNP